jgi:hypothetical protein
MAPFVLLNTRLWMDGFDLGGYKNRISLSGDAELKEHTRFGDSGRRRAGGLRDPQLKGGGFWDTAGTGFEPDKVIFDRLGVADAVVTCGPQDGNEGSVGYFFRAIHGLYRPGEAVGEILKYEVEAQGSDGVGLTRGIIIANKSVAAGGPTNGTAFNVGAIAAGQTLYAALHVIAVTTSVDVKIQRDTTGFPSPVDALTFAQKTARGSEFLSLAGPQTDDWWRVVFTVVGGAPNAQFVVTIGIK